MLYFFLTFFKINTAAAALAAGDKPHRKNVDLKSVIITILIRNNNNNNSENNNPFKALCPQSLVHNGRMKVTIKSKTQQTFRTIIKEKMRRPGDQDKQAVLEAIKNETLTDKKDA